MLNNLMIGLGKQSDNAKLNANWNMSLCTAFKVT